MCLLFVCKDKQTNKIFYKQKSYFEDIRKKISIVNELMTCNSYYRCIEMKKKIYIAYSYVNFINIYNAITQYKYRMKTLFS